MVEMDNASEAHGLVKTYRGEARVDLRSEIARLAGDEGLTILRTTH